MADLNTQTLPALAQPAPAAAANPVSAKDAQAAADRAALLKSFSMQNPLVAAGADIATLPGRALGGAYNTLARLPNALGANLPTISDTSPFFGGNSASMTPYYDQLRQPAAPAPATTPAAATPTPTPAPVVAPTVAPVTQKVSAPVTPLSATLTDWAKQAPTSEQMGTRYALAARQLAAESGATSAQAQATNAQTAQEQLFSMPREIGQIQALDPLSGMATRNQNIYGQLNPTTHSWDTIMPKLPQIVAKPALPAKADLKVGQLYPGYGKWTGTGFQPQ
ncbi:MAG: hypothetical protein ACYC36_02340 [Bellilinea sp.]